MAISKEKTETFDEDIIDLTDIIERGDAPPAENQETSAPLEKQIDDLMGDSSVGVDSSTDTDIDALLDEIDKGAAQQGKTMDASGHMVDPNEQLSMPNMSEVDALLEELDIPPQPAPQEVPKETPPAEDLDALLSDLLNTPAGNAGAKAATEQSPADADSPPHAAPPSADDLLNDLDAMLDTPAAPTAKAAPAAPAAPAPSADDLLNDLDAMLDTPAAPAAKAAPAAPAAPAPSADDLLNDLDAMLEGAPAKGARPSTDEILETVSHQEPDTTAATTDRKPEDLLNDLDSLLDGDSSETATTMAEAQAAPEDMLRDLDAELSDPAGIDAVLNAPVSEPEQPVSAEDLMLNADDLLPPDDVTPPGMDTATTAGADISMEDVLAGAGATAAAVAATEVATPSLPTAATTTWREPLPEVDIAAAPVATVVPPAAAPVVAVHGTTEQDLLSALSQPSSAVCCALGQVVRNVLVDEMEKHARQQDFASLENKLNSLDAQLSDNTLAIQGFADRLSSIDSQLAGYIEEKEQVQQRLAQLEQAAQDQEQLRQRLDAVEAQVKEQVPQRIDAVEAQIQELQGNVQPGDGQELESLTSGQIALEDRLSALEEQLQTQGDTFQNTIEKEAARAAAKIIREEITALLAEQ